MRNEEELSLGPVKGCGKAFPSKIKGHRKVRGKRKQSQRTACTKRKRSASEKGQVPLVRTLGAPAKCGGLCWVMRAPP